MCLWLMNFAKETNATVSNPVLLLLDNVWFHDHAKRVVKDWPEIQGVRIEFLPKNSTSYTQPLDLGPIASLKKGARRHEVRTAGVMVRLDGTQGNIPPLRKLNFYAASWDEMKPSVIANCFAESPAFFYKDGMTLPSRVLDRLARFESGELDATSGEFEVDRFAVNRGDIVDARGNNIITLHNPDEDMLAFPDNEDGDMLLSGVGGVTTGLSYFAAPAKIRPPTVLEMLNGLSVESLYPGGDAALQRRYRFLLSHKTCSEKTVKLERKRVLETDRQRRIGKAKRLRSSGFDDDSLNASFSEHGLTPTSSFSVDDDDTDEESEVSTVFSPPHDLVATSWPSPEPVFHEPFSPPRPNRKIGVFCFPPGSELVGSSGLREVLTPGQPLDGFKMRPFAVTLPYHGDTCMFFPPASRLIYADKKLKLAVVDDRLNKYELA